MIELKEYYQPVPFPEYKDVRAQRNDCEERYQVIQKNYGDFKGKTLIDVCCANGFFCFRFLQDEGKLAKGIEKENPYILFINTLATEKKMEFVCHKAFPIGRFDIGIYLDTHYAPGTEEYPRYLAEYTDVCFTSCACRDSTNEDYKKLLRALFKKVIPIYTGFQERVIFKCE